MVNPYEPPRAPPQVAVRPAAVVYEMATAHRGMMWLLLVRFGADFATNMIGDAVNMVGGSFRVPLLMIFLAAYVGIAAASGFFAFQLGRAIYGVGPAVVCFLLSLVPCLGMLTILVLGGTAMDQLRKAGVRVDFMGATSEQVRNLRLAAENALLEEERF